MEKNITYTIVKKLIDDMLGRYKVDAIIGNAYSREEINIQIGMFETWRELVSVELLKSGIIQQGYTQKSDKEIEDMDLNDILDLRDFYIKWQAEKA